MSDNPGIDRKPSPATVLWRWPLAMAAIGKLIEAGDKKHRDTDESQQGLLRIEEHYDWRYSVRKGARHEARWAAGEEIDEETGVPHPVNRAWHAINAAESYLVENGYELEDLFRNPAEPAIKDVIEEGDYVGGQVPSGLYFEGTLLEIRNNQSRIALTGDVKNQRWLNNDTIKKAVRPT